MVFGGDEREDRGEGERIKMDIDKVEIKRGKMCWRVVCGYRKGRGIAAQDATLYIHTRTHLPTYTHTYLFQVEQVDFDDNQRDDRQRGASGGAVMYVCLCVCVCV
jgi:hypothetical protein